MRIPLGIILILVLGCNNTPLSKAISKEQEISKRRKDPLQIEMNRYFSSKQDKDRFILKIEGDSILNSTINFRIINSKGKVLYEDSFPSNALIGYDLIEIEQPTVEDERDAIENNLRRFMEENNFESPAITKEEIFDSRYNMDISKDHWEEIKKDTESVSFYYKLDEGNGKWITYSKMLDKIVIFKVCC